MLINRNIEVRKTKNSMNIKTVSFLIVLLFSNMLIANTYYVNSEVGSDANTGKSKSKPWKTLWKVNQQVFKPGDKILFAAGTSYEGKLVPKGSGKEGNVIKIDRYGKGANPAIHGNGYNEYTLLLYNVELTPCG